MPHRLLMSPAIAGLAVSLFVAIAMPRTAIAQAVVSTSSDVTIESGAGVVAQDHDVAVDNQLGIVLLEALGSLPESADVIAYGMDANGDLLLAFDTTVDLAGVVAMPGDLVRWDGATHSIAFDASVAGVPPGAKVDALSLAPGGFLLSFDTTVDLGGGVIAADEDLVRWDGAIFSLALDASAVGFPAALDVDGAQDEGGGAFLLSFDTAGAALGMTFDDDDVLRYFDGALALEYDASAADPSWAAADVDALFVPESGFGLALLLGAGTLARVSARRRRAEGRRLGAMVPGAMLAFIFFGAGVAPAADGVREINQTCAVQTGCFSGDAAGYPVTIDGTAGGSYVLTSDLVVASSSETAISISVADVTVDMGGFGIARTDCAGGAATCAPTIGVGSGISSTSARIAVANGSVSGMGANGVSLGADARIERVRVRASGSHGLVAGSASQISNSVSSDNGGDGIRSLGGVVRDSTAEDNGQNGILATVGSALAGNVARNNTGDGFQLAEGTTVVGNSSYSNGVRGFYAGDVFREKDGVTMKDNTAYDNGGAGFVVGDGCNVTGNTSFDNGGDGIETGDGSIVERNAAHTNGGDGIQAGDGSTVRGNTAQSNTGFGLNLVAGTGYTGNVVSGNSGGTVQNGIDLGENVCGGTLGCP